MTETKKPAWLNYLALMTLVLAVCTTLASYEESGYITEAMNAQIQAANQWSYFQAKNTRSTLYQTSKNDLELQLKNLSADAEPRIIENYKQEIAATTGQISKYENEKNEIQLTARKMEDQRDRAQRNGAPFGQAVIILQLAIIPCAIAGIMERKLLWFLSFPLAAWGLVNFANGFFLFL